MIHVEPEWGLYGKSQEFALISPLLTCDLWDVTLSVSFRFLMQKDEHMDEK